MMLPEHHHVARHKTTYGCCNTPSKGCPITQADIFAAKEKYGPNLGSLKGKTVDRPNPHVSTGVDPVPHEILKLHKSITICIDIMFINKIPFFMTLSWSLKFGTVEALSNRQVPTIIDKIGADTWLYQHCGFQVTSIMADPEFKPIRPSFPFLNCYGAHEQVLDIE